MRWNSGRLARIDEHDAEEANEEMISTASDNGEDAAPNDASSSSSSSSSTHGIALVREDGEVRQLPALSAEVLQQQHPYSIFCGLVPLKGPKWGYLIMACIDVYANYFTVLAFKYTTITSVTLFDALAIPTSMVLSWTVLKRQFSLLHFVGVFMCSIGIALNVMQDYHEDMEHNNSSNGGNDTGDDTAVFQNKLRGDVYALLGGVMFGINNVAGEYAVRSLGGVCEYLGMLGLYATVICTVQSALLERTEIAEFFGSDENKTESCKESSLWYLLAVYFLASILSYLGGSRFLQISEATFFNLSLLTGDLWSVAFSVIAERIVPHFLFFIALAFILSGVVLYEMAPSPVKEDREHEEDVRARREEPTTDSRVLISTPGVGTTRTAQPQAHSSDYDLALNGTMGARGGDRSGVYELTGQSSSSSHSDDDNQRTLS